MPYQSRLLRYLSTLTFALPLVAGWMGESCALEIGVLDLVADDPDYVCSRTRHGRTHRTLADPRSWCMYTAHTPAARHYEGRGPLVQADTPSVLGVPQDVRPLQRPAVRRPPSPHPLDRAVC